MKKYHADFAISLEKSQFGGFKWEIGLGVISVWILQDICSCFNEAGILNNYLKKK